ncbi:hypothetical protein BJX65DRAFT_311416 [Aspergillus insuetus]
MVSPFNGVPTYACNNVNGFLLSILAWLGGAEQTTGERDFPGFSIYTTESLEKNDLPASCVTALTALIKCNPKDKTTGEYCNNIIDCFTIVDSMGQMPEDEICSYCFVERHQMMQRSPYSPYDEYYKSVLEEINTRCGLSGPTKIKEVPLDPVPTEEALCLLNETYTTSNRDTCTSIATAHSVSSAALYMGNQDIIQWCSSINPGLDLCLPLSCTKTYELQPSNTCSSIEYAFELGRGGVRKYNPWVSSNYANMHIASEIYGTIIRLSPQGGKHVNDHDGTGTTPSPSNGYANTTVPPPTDAIVAEGTTLH